MQISISSISPMSKSSSSMNNNNNNMLRTRRRDNNVKPNRRLDRKSSRGMIYENEELRLKTININAEIERGQSDIKKLRRENEMLKKEIWYLRDEYEKLDKLLKQKQVEFASSSSSSSSSTEASSSSSSSDTEMESTQNMANVQLAVVAEEEADALPPDESYPPPDVLVTWDTCNGDAPSTPPQQNHAHTFSNGGNVEDLLKDIESISMDILQMSSSTPRPPSPAAAEHYTSEVSMVLMPTAMPLLGFDKYRTLATPAIKDSEPRRKVSLLHLRGRKQKTNLQPPGGPPPSSDSEHAANIIDNHNKSTSASPERSTHRKRKKHRSAICRQAAEPLPPPPPPPSFLRPSASSYSIYTDRSTAAGGGAGEEYAPSSKTPSSCGTHLDQGHAEARGGKIPWCACWGNGCL